jgi:hypothetical protein
MVQFDDLLRAQCLSSSMYFNRYFFKQRFNRKFVVNWHHELICEHLDKVLSGEIKRLAIRIAPRYGKTELAVKNFIAHGLALNPESKFIHLSYSSELAIDNSEEVRDFVTTDEYKRLFPYVKLSKSSSAKHKWYTESGGGVYATSTGGQITGFGAGEVDEEYEDLISEIHTLAQSGTNKFSGAIIIDDPIKPDDAYSDTKRERINQRFETTIRSRTNSRNTPIIVIGQAVHERDLIGYLMETEPEEWTLLTIPAISLDEDGNEVALWEFKHTLAELHKIREADERTFDTQYQQDPKDLLGLLLPKSSLKFIDIPEENVNSGRYLFCDPADQGGDKLSAIFIDCFVEETKLLCHVHEAIHTDKGILAMAPILYDKIVEYSIEETFIESNGVGLALIIALKQIIKNEGTKYKITPITSKDPKEVRFMRNYEFVQKHFSFLPEEKQNRDYKNYISDLTSYKRDGQNLHKKDALDVSCQGAEILKIKFRSILFKK